MVVAAAKAISFSDESMACKYLMKSTAFRLKQSAYGTEYLLVGLLHYNDERAARILVNNNITMSNILGIVSKNATPTDTPVLATRLTRKATIDSVFDKAGEKAESRVSEHVEPLDILWGILSVPTCEAYILLKHLAANIPVLQAQIEQAYIEGKVTLKGPYWMIKEALGDPSLSDEKTLQVVLENIQADKQGE